MRDFTVLVMPGAFASSVAATLDMLDAAARLAPRLQHAPPRWRVVSPGGGRIALRGGLMLETARMTRRPRRDRSVWVIPGLGEEDPEALIRRLDADDARAAARAIRCHVAQHGEVAAACSAVYLLHAATVLDHRRVTTSWWLASTLQQRATSCTVDADRMVCVDGPICTAGAAFAQSDLMLHLLRTRFGTPLADAVGKVLLIDARQAQAPYAIPSLLASGNALVRRLTERIETGLPALPSMAQLAREQAMSVRTLSRHVRAATGKAPLALVQSIRLSRARHLIETSRLSIDAIAAQVGYEDATALRRLMRKAAGASPRQFRCALHRE
ncbi:GlxA family transcriptional regulator [Tahibacter amnicola]|uniref:Helix-turn-helix domain-containing protein n=1 Tax=Tahibacter amnicola TaxID=2976241 RepID=A0ABY6BL94_9GAMM|nr:helix-turn-helix domain-containing protein [Tahibacter amnicola]UXI70539.1 helix-turn-helix domain-containing protein [Tahibacter amnicola]